MTRPVGLPAAVDLWRRVRLGLLIGAALALAGCSGASGDGAQSSAPIGQDIMQALPPGEAQAGGRLSLQLGCEGCHRDLPLAPAWQSGQPAPISERAAERIASSDYSGQARTAEQYLLESIVNPAAFVVPGYESGVMPALFGEQLTRQQAADLVAYLLSLE